MELKLGPEILTSYSRLSYRAWHALAEFVDNSTQAYFNNFEMLDPIFKEKGEKLTVRINYVRDDKDSEITIKDNSIGMSEEELSNAVILGKKPEITDGRSKYGLGMKTAACWLGDFWVVETSKLGENKARSIEIDVDRIAQNDLDLRHNEYEEDEEAHYTKITIKRLNRKFYGRTIGKIKDHLRSIYRIDLQNQKLDLYWQGEKLDWEEFGDFDELLLKNEDGDLYKKEFEFTIQGKKVFGWAGILEKGSRAYAGFSLIQADRVINGWPDSYRPPLLYGHQEGGSNDLVNQRLLGEIILDGFEVSHTKDAILFTDDEEDELDFLLHEELSNYREIALSYRKYGADERIASTDATEKAVNVLVKELDSNLIEDKVFIDEVPDLQVIKYTNKSISDRILESDKPTLDAKIGMLDVRLYINSDMSPNDPYLIIDATSSDKYVIVIVNKAHPHWAQLKSDESITNFIRHCIYDGVAEWKAFHKKKSLDPDTIKLIKDSLLRIPLEMEN